MRRRPALVPCAGTGVRTGCAGPKQYGPPAGRTLIGHTLAALAAVERVARIVVVTASADRTLTTAVC